MANANRGYGGPPSKPREKSDKERELEFQVEAASTIQTQSFDSQKEIDSHASEMPDKCDGGDGAEYIASMMSKITEDADLISRAASIGGDKMTEATYRINGVDNDVAQEFRQLERKIP
ncbi:hypothetical protein [Actinomyces naeslundii]|jgi:hypothetical protein|uniref:hypothetical protein n=1 Tax=Actinomyces naeslundii TaxID=1655 RepID=UPI000B2BA38A|nr:hypothetical protein [Actinomyces naeslundii]